MKELRWIKQDMNSQHASYFAVQCQCARSYLPPPPTLLHREGRTAQLNHSAVIGSSVHTHMDIHKMFGAAKEPWHFSERAALLLHQKHSV